MTLLFFKAHPVTQAMTTAAKPEELDFGQVAKPAMIKSLLVISKAHVGPYLRGGKLVNLSGYQGRNAQAQAHAAAGQLDMFARPSKPLGPNPYKGKDPVADTIDMFGGEPTHTEPTADLVQEHKRLVAVLRSPSHEDDKVEAKKQAEELAELEGEHDHLLADIPGAKWARGKGLISGQYGVEVDGGVVGNFHVKPEDAVVAAKQQLAIRAEFDKAAKAKAQAIANARERILNGGEVTDGDLSLLGLRPGSSGLEWFIPAAAELFGVTSRAVRPHIKDLIKVGHTDMGTKKEFVEPKKALAAMAASIKPAADYNAAVTSTKQGPSDDNPRRKFYVTIARDGRGVSRLAGPFDTHDEAKGHVERARKLAEEIDPRAAFDSFGTAGVEADSHPPGVLNERLGLTPKAGPYVATTTDDHPAPMHRGLLSLIPEDRRDEWKDLHRQQHELHHYEMGQVRERQERLRSKRNKVQTAYAMAAAGLNDLKSAPIRDPHREAEAQKHVDTTHADLVKLVRELDGLAATHQSLYEKVSRMGRVKDKIFPGSGDMDRDFSSMKQRSVSDQQEHEKSMLKLYRDHYRAKSRP